MQAIILTADGVEDWELMYPYFRLREAHISVDIAAPRKGPLAGRHNCYPVEANVSFFEMWGAEFYDLMLLPGGTAPEAFRHNERVHSSIKGMLEAGKTVAAIGHGVETLVSMGVVKGKRATCAEGVRDELQLAGAQYVDQPVVVEGNLITSRGIDDLPDFCREVLKAVQAPAAG